MRQDVVGSRRALRRLRAGARVVCDDAGATQRPTAAAVDDDAFPPPVPRRGIPGRDDRRAHRPQHVECQRSAVLGRQAGGPRDHQLRHVARIQRVRGARPADVRRCSLAKLPSSPHSASRITNTSTCFPVSAPSPVVAATPMWAVGCGRACRPDRPPGDSRCSPISGYPRRTTAGPIRRPRFRSISPRTSVRCSRVDDAGDRRRCSSIFAPPDRSADSSTRTSTSGASRVCCSRRAARCASFTGPSGAGSLEPCPRQAGAGAATA